MFGEIYGYFFMIFALGTAVGPATAGAMFQMAGSYQPALIGDGGHQSAWHLCLSGGAWKGHYRVRGAEETGLAASHAGMSDGWMILRFFERVAIDADGRTRRRLHRPDVAGSLAR
jgi:hypothetical protein